MPCIRMYYYKHSVRNDKGNFTTITDSNFADICDGYVILMCLFESPKLIGFRVNLRR